MKVLVVVASKHGSTREIGEVIAEELRAEGLESELEEAGAAVEIGGHDAVILGSAIYMGTWLAEAKRFAECHRPELAGLPLWLFSSGPLGADERQAQPDPQALAAPLGEVPVREHRIFDGKLDKAELGLVERLVVRLVKAPQGDYRDWEAVRAWAREIAAALRSAPVGERSSGHGRPRQ